MNFESFSIDDLVDETLRALGFHISATEYLEERSSRFTEVIDLELTSKPAVVDNPGQIVTDSKEEVVKKKNKRAAKTKERLTKFCALVESLLSPCPKSSFFLLPHSVPAPMPALVSTPVLSLVLAPMLAFVPTPVSALVPVSLSRSGSPVVLSSGRMPTPAAVSRRKIPALILPLPILGLSLLL